MAYELLDLKSLEWHEEVIKELEASQRRTTK